MKRIIFLTLVLTLSALSSKAQDAEASDKKFRLEIEPASFAFRGFSGSLLYALTPDNSFSLGLYAASVNVPVFTRRNMFDNVGEDTSSVRLGFQAALMARYNINIFKNMESNPYVGLIFGWEYFDIDQPYNPETLRITTFIATPYVGYEFYFYKQMLFLNPQLRGVFYFGDKSSDASRPEQLTGGYLLPQLSLGVRF
ncbi:MAG: hypothetical protein MK078_04545 [Crocinitomicaceae bacterium]|nr:hypothetical protein [Crocinitomicaceae bacterium]